MEDLLKEAIDILGGPGGWLSSDAEIETIDAMLATIFVVFALKTKEEEESNIPKLLESLIDILSKFRTKEANALIAKVKTDLKNEWMPKISEREVLIL